MDTTTKTRIGTANKNAAQTLAAAPVADRLLHPDEAKHILGSRSVTNHVLHRLARAGKLHAVRLGARTIRFRESEVLALVAGKEAA